jgi:hypothetical protein
MGQVEEYVTNIISSIVDSTLILHYLWDPPLISNYETRADYIYVLQKSTYRIYPTY